MSVGVLLLTHEAIGKALISAARHVLARLPLDGRRAVKCRRTRIRPDLCATRTAKHARELDHGDGVLVLSDLYGATPCNIGLSLAELGVHLHCVSGLNLPMLLRVLNYSEKTLPELAEIAATGGRGGIFVDHARKGHHDKQPPRPACTRIGQARATLHGFQSTVWLIAGVKEVNAKSIMGVMMLAAGLGALTVRADGPDEEAAIAAVVDLFDRKFDEGKREPRDPWESPREARMEASELTGTPAGAARGWRSVALASSSRAAMTSIRGRSTTRRSIPELARLHGALDIARAELR